MLHYTSKLSLDDDKNPIIEIDKRYSPIIDDIKAARRHIANSLISCENVHCDDCPFAVKNYITDTSTSCITNDIIRKIDEYEQIVKDITGEK